jgi:hypothetical protein
MRPASIDSGGSPLRARAAFVPAIRADSVGETPTPVAVWTGSRDQAGQAPQATARAAPAIGTRNLVERVDMVAIS